MKLITIPGSILIGIILFSCQHQPKVEEELTVFCAAGVSNIIQALSDSFELVNQVDIKLNLASSGTLARQIEQGYVPDIYISASKQWADYAWALQLFTEQKSLYKNQLAIICPVAGTLDTIDFSRSALPEFNGLLSMGDPAHVPAGQYAKEALSSLGWWVDLENRILPSKDVRSALIPVELGECELGIVYYSDALVSEKIRIAGIFPDSTHTPIVFTALLSKSSSKSAKMFYELLSNSIFEPVWLKNGLSPITEE